MGLPGAVQHAHGDCKTPHFIRPGLYAFWKLGSTPLKAFVWEKVKFEPNTLSAFIGWFTGMDARTRLPNHILLFWCIMSYWKV